MDEIWAPAAGDRVLLQGVIADPRDGFALVTVEGSQPPGTYITVAYPAMEPFAPLGIPVAEAPHDEPGPELAV